MLARHKIQDPNSLQHKATSKEKNRAIPTNKETHNTLNKYQSHTQKQITGAQKMEQSPSEKNSIHNSKAASVRKNPCSLVRFSREQFAKIENDANAFGKSVPDLLRSAYFAKKLEAPRFASIDADRIVAAINRVGNNLNQIAKHLNTGFREGYQTLLDEAVILLVGIKAEVTVGHERR